MSISEWQGEDARRRRGESTDDRLSAIIEGERPPGPLSGIRVINLTRVLSGPYCATLLGELGAEIIKIERPGRGDHSRRVRGSEADTGLRYSAWNMYCKSVTLDIWKPEGAELFKMLVAKTDVVLENFRPNVMASAGLDYETLKAINPRIIMASISGFGRGNHYAQFPAHASVISAFAGVQHLNRFGDGPPMPTPGASPDIQAGVYAALGIVAALNGVHRTGQGRHVDISMADCIVGGLAFELMSVLLTGKAPTEREIRAGDGHSATEAGPAFHQCYRAKDGWFYVQADLPAQWKRLAEVIGGPELAADPRFETEGARSANREELDRILSAWLGKRTKDEAFEILGSAGVPCSPAYSLAEVARHPYLRERGIIQEIDDPRAGKLAAITPRVRFAGEPRVRPTPAPELGEDTDAVLGDLLGLESTTVQKMREKGVI